MLSAKSAAKDNKKSCMPLIVNIGIYISILNIFITSFIIFIIVQLFIAPLSFNVWISLFGVFSFALLSSLIFIIFLFSKIIINNSLFLKREQKNEKKYFIAAIIFFFFNSLISFSMFKNLLVSNEGS